MTSLREFSLRCANCFLPFSEFHRVQDKKYCGSWNKRMMFKTLVKRPGILVLHGEEISLIDNEYNYTYPPHWIVACIDKTFRNVFLPLNIKDLSNEIKIQVITKLYFCESCILKWFEERLIILEHISQTCFICKGNFQNFFEIQNRLMVALSCECLQEKGKEKLIYKSCSNNYFMEKKLYEMDQNSKVRYQYAKQEFLKSLTEEQKEYYSNWFGTKELFVESSIWICKKCLSLTCKERKYFESCHINIPRDLIKLVGEYIEPEAIKHNCEKLTYE